MAAFTGKVLALDLATTTGYAIGRPGEAPHFGSHSFTRTSGSRPAVYRHFRAWLDVYWARDRPDVIVYEAPNAIWMGGRTTASTIRLLLGLPAILEEWCHDRVALNEVTVAAVRSHFLGRNFKAATAKPMTIERCHALGWMVKDADEADACALLDYEICRLCPDRGHETAPLFCGAVIND